jgi:hypothetical protein
VNTIRQATKHNCNHNNPNCHHQGPNGT